MQMSKSCLTQQATWSYFLYTPHILTRSPKLLLMSLWTSRYAKYIFTAKWFLTLCSPYNHCRPRRRCKYFSGQHEEFHSEFTDMKKQSSQSQRS